MVFSARLKQDILNSLLLGDVGPLGGRSSVTSGTTYAN
jgi:hypothetical protein